MNTKYLLTLEFRFTSVNKDKTDTNCNNKTITLGVFDSFEDACIEGNKNLEIMESRFSLHVFPKGHFANKERFSKNGGCFNSRKNLITNLAYLKTPFDFYFKITNLNYQNIESFINDTLISVNEYKDWKKKDID